MKNFSKVMLSIIFTALIVGSVQPVLADYYTDTFKPVPIKNSEYQFHVQVVLRDADGKLIGVTEATNGYYIQHDATDYYFDNNFGKKEIVTVDNIKYEKVQFTQKYTTTKDFLMFMIPAIIEVPAEQETIIVTAYIFQAFVPLVYMEEGEVANAHWTIFRNLN